MDLFVFRDACDLEALPELDLDERDEFNVCFCFRERPVRFVECERLTDLLEYFLRFDLLELADGDFDLFFDGDKFLGVRCDAF